MILLSLLGASITAHWIHLTVKHLRQELRYARSRKFNLQPGIISELILVSLAMSVVDCLFSWWLRPAMWVLTDRMVGKRKGQIKRRRRHA